jgi:hypothetical protein
MTRDQGRKSHPAYPVACDLAYPVLVYHFDHYRDNQIGESD